MPTWIVPSDTHVPSDTGHTTDHNHVADDLTLVNNVVPVVSGGLTGAVAATRFAGATASGAPASGTFAVGDYVIDQTGKIFICTAAGSPGTWKQANNPMTTTGDLITGGASGVPSRLAVGSVNQVLGVSSGAPAWQPNMTRQVATANAGYTMVNGTGTIVTFTTPNDGNVHLVQLDTLMRTTTTMTGGAVNLSFTDPSGAAVSFTGILAGGFTAPATNTTNFNVFCAANTAVTISQGTAMTAGAAKVWADLWCA